MGLSIDVGGCDACGGGHENVELFAPPVPEKFRVWGGLARTAAPWYLCPVFLYAVLVPLKALKQ